MANTENTGLVELSDTQFLATALSAKPATAVFDCDGTLWAGDAGYGFLLWSLDQGLVSRNASDWIDSRYRLYRNGEVSEAAMCGEMVQIYAGLREEEMRRASAEFFHTHIQADIFPVFRSLLQEFRALDTEIWAVSSTNNWVIEEGLRELEIPASRILAARVKVADGVVTSELLDVPTGEGKRLALQRIGLIAPDCVFGNSIHDEAMLEIAKHPFAVNPSPELVTSATRNGWPVYFPQSSSRP